MIVRPAGRSAPRGSVVVEDRAVVADGDYVTRRGTPHAHEVLACPRCGQEMRIVAFITEPTVIS